MKNERYITILQMISYSKCIIPDGELELLGPWSEESWLLFSAKTKVSEHIEQTKETEQTEESEDLTDQTDPTDPTVPTDTKEKDIGGSSFSVSFVSFSSVFTCWSCCCSVCSRCVLGRFLLSACFDDMPGQCMFLSSIWWWRMVLTTCLSVFFFLCVWIPMAGV